uniref:hypothetical protein n=1 Tax=Actinokineospora sp. CA-119265 TaxID=3239890 RepID=UPI003F493FB7
MIPHAHDQSLTERQRRHLDAAKQVSARLNETLAGPSPRSTLTWLAAAALAVERAHHLDQVIAHAAPGAGTGGWQLAARDSRADATRFELWAHLAHHADEADSADQAA